MLILAIRYGWTFDKRIPIIIFTLRYQIGKVLERFYNRGRKSCSSTDLYIDRKNIKSSFSELEWLSQFGLWLRAATSNQEIEKEIFEFESLLKRVPRIRGLL